MEKQEIEMIEQFAAQDPELKELWGEHQLFEKQVAKLESKSFLTPAEQQELRALKKQKLDGKTKLMSLVDRYKAKEA